MARAILIFTIRAMTRWTRSTGRSSTRTSPRGRRSCGWPPTATWTFARTAAPRRGRSPEAAAQLRAGGHCRKLPRMSEQVLVSRAEGVCEVRFNRPEKRNALTFAMYEAFGRALHEAQADTAVRAVLLSGEGAGFSAGNDLNDFIHGPQFSSDHPVMGLLRALATFGKPLLAAVHGQTVGIGVTMLLHCDLVVAARSTQLSMPFVTLGLVSEAASSLLLPRLGGQQGPPGL